jgi:hypothetical protein
MVTPNAGTIAVVVCCVAAVAEGAMTVASSTGLTLADAPIVLFLIGPYLVMGWLAWTQRGRRVVSGILPAVASLRALWGLYVSGLDCYRYHTEPHYRLVQRMGIFVVPLCQWLVTLLLGSVLLGLWLRTRRPRVPDCPD